MKTMKYITVLILSLVVLASCESWLDVSPAAEIKEDSQFSNEQGFKDALYGAYTRVTSDKLYGRQTTFGFLTAMTYAYSNQGAWSGIYAAACRYDYTNAEIKGWIDDIWNETYSAIAHVNLILRNVDKKKSVMTEQVYNMVKGEMLGLRAYLHFDLFRLYAPAYSAGADLTELTIPYREEFGITATPPLSMQDFMGKVLGDITEACKYLETYKEIDLMGEYVGHAAPGGDDFMMYRQNRFNYYAARALEARACMYMGNKTGAAAAAGEVIDSRRFHFITADEANATGAAKDYVFTPELIFALYDSKLQDRADYYFTENTQPKPGAPAFWLQLNAASRSTLYEVSAGGSSDMRYVKQWAASGTNTYCTKYWQLDNMDMAVRNQIPLLKLGEMYLILAEAKADPEVLNRMREARALAPNINSGTLDIGLAGEYRKEFFAEGQFYFYYKRMGIARFPNAGYDAKFVFPIPDNEKVYGEY